jgi:hypothetical protein
MMIGPWLVEQGPWFAVAVWRGRIAARVIQTPRYFL